MTGFVDSDMHHYIYREQTIKPLFQNYEHYGIRNLGTGQWTIPHFVIKMYKSPPSIVLLPCVIHSLINFSQA